eukprot:5122063-Amphidinium_carterae.1
MSCGEPPCSLDFPFEVCLQYQTHVHAAKTSSKRSMQLEMQTKAVLSLFHTHRVTFCGPNDKASATSLALLFLGKVWDSTRAVETHQNPQIQNKSFRNTKS